MSVKLLFAKLGHSLEEIRVRALQNILSKLDHGLLTDSDLVQEKHLHIRLLEWFNFSSCVLQEEVLSLILRLTKHSSAAQIYVDIGAVEFLSQLRPNVDVFLHRVIDSILDNLFHLPDTADDRGQHECIYQHQRSSTLAGVVGEPVYGVDSITDSSLLTVLSHRYITTQHGTAAGTGPGTYSSQHGAAYSSQCGVGGYFASEGQEPTAHHILPVTMAAKFLKFATFPWVALTPTDRHVLSSTNDSVRSRDISMVVSVCEFLTDVVFQDFPAEVFLQRPSIVKNVLLLVHDTSPTSVLLSAVQTLSDLAVNLASRIKFHQDPCFYTARQVTTATSDTSTLTTATQSFSSSVDVPTTVFIGQARHRGDGQDIDNTASSSDTQSFGLSMPANMDMIEQTDLDDVFSLQFVQWTVAQFCFQVLEKVVPCLQGAVDEQLSMQCFELMHQVASLLADSLIAAALWEDTSVAAHELIESFHEVLDSISKAVYTHHHTNLSPITPSIELERHRVVFIGLAVFTVRLLDALVPRTSVSVAVPREFAAVLLTFRLDHTFSTEFPEIASSSLEIAETLDAEMCGVYHELSQVRQSETSTCRFLSAFQQLTDESYTIVLQLAQDSLPSLQYHVCLDVVDASVTLASFVCKKSSPSVKSVQQSRDILLSVMSHDVDTVRLRAYQNVYNIVKEALGIELVCEPTSSSTLAAMFLVDAKVLYQLCCFGMADVQEIRDMSEKTLLYLLQSQLLMPATRWQQLIDAVCAVHAVIQSCCDPSTSLGRCIVGLLETDPRIDTGTLPLLERLRGCVRLMFHANAASRECGAERLLKLLSMEDESSRKLPSVSDVDLDRLHDIFVVKSPRTLSADSLPSVCQASDVKKVYDIFISDSVDVTVRRSAADQLATILADASLHTVFTQLGGVTSAVDLLKSAVRIHNESLRQQTGLVMLVAPVMKLLRSLTERDSSLRHRLAHETDVYFTLVRCGLIHQKDEEVRHDLSELLALLVFDEMAAVQEWTSSGILQPDPASFSLPSCIAHRYRLPFITTTHHTRSPWLGKSQDNQSQLSLHSGLPAEALRIAWNVAWHDGIAEALAGKNCSSERYHERMSLTALDQLIMSTTHLPYALRQCIYAVNNATSHTAVSKALCRLRWYLVVSSPVSSVVQHLSSVPWKAAIARFLTVAPSTGADEQLVLDIVKFLAVVVTRCEAGTMSNETFSWIGEMLLCNSGALYHLLNKTDQSCDSIDGRSSSQLGSRDVGRQLLRFVLLFISRCHYQLTGSPVRRVGAGEVSLSVGRVGSSQFSVDGDLVRCIFMKINRVDSVQSYNLPSLELTLLTLMHVTARQGWSLTCSSADCLTLCLEMLQTLLEVVSAFHAGRGGLLMSYMGRGITRCASVCLRHLAHEMSTHLRSQEWPRNWLFVRSSTVDSVGDSGLHWLFPLWIYRDIEVRVAGVSIAVALTTTEVGRITMATQCHNVPGGIWGAAFGLLLDAAECSAVRQQAALLLVNLTSQSLPSDGDMQLDTVIWQGPVVRNEESQVSLVGLPALLMLLQHLEFFSKIHLLISSLSVQLTVRPITTLTHVNAGHISTTNTLSSQNTLTTAVSVTSTVSTALLVDLTTSSQLVDSWAGQSDLQTSSLPGQGQGHSDLENDIVRRRHVTGEGHSGDALTLTAATARTLTGPPCVSGLSSTVADSDTAAPVNDDSSHSSSSSSTSSSSSSRASVVTPSLVSSVCCLLSNLLSLAPHDISTALHTYAILQTLMQTVEECRHLVVYPPTSTPTHLLLVFTDTVVMYRDVVSLMSAVTVTDSECRRRLFGRQSTITSLTSLLAVAYQHDSATSLSCVSLWKSVFDMMSSLLQSAGQDAYIALTSPLVNQWTVVSGRLLHVTQDKSYLESELHFSVLNFIALLFTEEVKFKLKLQGHRDLDFPYISDCLDNVDVDQTSADCSSTGPSGSLLCRALVSCLDAVLLKPLVQQQFFVMKAAVINALKSLLAISSVAKTTALEVGLLESLCEHIRHLHNTLSMDALDLSKLPASSKKKVSPSVTELILTFDLLRNFLFDSDEVKRCASKSSLANLIHSVWCWCLTNTALMSSVLAMLSAYTAHCPTACSSLACTTASVLLPMTTTSSLGKYSNNNSLCHCLIRLIQKETASSLSPASDGNSFTSVLRPAFQLAATLTISPECRGVMWKSNFLHGFSTLSPQKTKKSKVATVQLDSLWLALFVNLSFSTEGQTMILRIDDALTLLIDYVSLSHETHQVPALLTLRNLCFHATNKPKLLANDKLLPLFLQHLDSAPSYSQSQTIACSAILALAYNNHKAKGLLKTGDVVRRLRDAYNRLETSSDTPASHSDSVPSCSQMICDILTLLRS